MGRRIGEIGIRVIVWIEQLEEIHIRKLDYQLREREYGALTRQDERLVERL